MTTFPNSPRLLKGGIVLIEMCHESQSQIVFSDHF